MVYEEEDIGDGTGGGGGIKVKTTAAVCARGGGVGGSFSGAKNKSLDNEGS